MAARRRVGNGHVWAHTEFGRAQPNIGRTALSRVDSKSKLVEPGGILAERNRTIIDPRVASHPHVFWPNHVFFSCHCSPPPVPKPKPQQPAAPSAVKNFAAPQVMRESVQGRESGGLPNGIRVRSPGVIRLLTPSHPKTRVLLFVGRGRNDALPLLGQRNSPNARTPTAISSSAPLPDTDNGAVIGREGMGYPGAATADGAELRDDSGAPIGNPPCAIADTRSLPHCLH